jgi:YVTN family beta-propeller protein
MGMVSVGSRLFVCNSGFGTGNTVSVIDVVSQLVEATLTVSDGPTDALLGKDGLVWISCTGNGFGVPPTPGKLFAINPATLAVEDSIVSSLSFVGPLASTIDGTLYLLAGSAGMSDGGSLFRIEPSGGSLTSVVPGAYYALGVDPTTDRIYLSDVNGFVADGEVSIYEPDGTFVGTLMAGKIPGAFAFKH